MASVLEPHRKKFGEFFNLSYELSDRLHAVAAYPVQAPNGSSILIRASDDGLTFLWRGGRADARQKPSRNGPRNQSRDLDDNVMVLDADDEDEDSQDPTGEISPIDIDPLQPYEAIVYEHHVTLDSTPLHLAVPPLHHTATSRPSAFIPSLFSQRVVVAAACVDGSVRIVSIPYTLPFSADASASSEDILTIPPKESLSPIADGIALSWTSNKTGPSRKNTDERDCELVVAVHFSEGTPSLAIHKVQLKVENRETFLAGCDQKWTRSQLLYSPAVSIAFNPCDYQSPRHTQILVVETNGAVRVFDPTPVILDDEIEQSAQMSDPKNWGSWLISLFPGFEDEGQISSGLRKRVIGAQWACNGKCIITLLGDGEWGLWDLECGGPQSSTSSKVHGHNSRAVNRFALHGYLGDAPIANNKLKSGKQLASTQPEKLAPMTPNTRKARQSNLFSIKSKPVEHVFATGSISVLPIGGVDEATPQESVVFRYKQNLFGVVNFMTYWQRAIASSSEFSPRLTKIPFSADGELVTDISQIYRHPVNTSDQNESHLPSDILLAAEHRFIVVAAELKPSQSRQPSIPLASLDQSFDSRANGSFNAADAQALLAGGELDLGGIDQMLDGLESAHTFRQNPLTL